MDGVLYDSMPNHGIAWQRAMKEFGIHFTVEDSYATEGARGVDTIRKYRIWKQEKAKNAYLIEIEDILPFYSLSCIKGNRLRKE